MYTRGKGYALLTIYILCKANYNKHTVRQRNARLHLMAEASEHFRSTLITALLMSSNYHSKPYDKSGRGRCPAGKMEI